MPDWRPRPTGAALTPVQAGASRPDHPQGDHPEGDHQRSQPWRGGGAHHHQSIRRDARESVVILNPALAGRDDRR